MNKKIFNSDNIRAKVIEGVDFICEPVASTLGPKGHNVVLENDRGEHILTNDGITIARQLSSSDPIVNTIVEIVKEASLRTNNEAGDGTTSTAVLVQTLVKEVLKLKDEGHSWIEIRNNLRDFGERLIKRIEKDKIAVDGKKGIREIATISANNDTEIADFVVEAINIAKEDGMVFIHPNNQGETEVIKDLGFMVRGGLMFEELLTEKGKLSVLFRDAPVLLTDKKIYYPEEAETIIRAAMQAKYKSLVVVARDFMGEAINTFIANHTGGVMPIMLVKAEDVDEKKSAKLQDLAVYIGGKVISEKTGTLVNKIKPSDFTVVNQVFTDPQKTLFTPKTTASKELKERIQMLKDELDKDKDNQELKSRLASLTTGVVTLKVGGNTPLEVREKVYRYEDAINAVRSAMKYGYLVGGGTSILKGVQGLDNPSDEFAPLYRKFGEAILRRIARNAGEPEEQIVKMVLASKKNEGYNALTGKHEDLLKAGVVDPFMVIKNAIENSISVAITIASVNHFVINDIEDDETKD